jgi:6-phosphofructokinase 1
LRDSKLYDFWQEVTVKRIAILTRDCAGVNAAIRAAVRTATSAGLEVLGVLRGYEGLIEGEFIPLDRRAVSSIINLGGTILKTARCERFFKTEGQTRAVNNLRTREVDGLIVIGGNGSLTGAHVVAETYRLRVVGVPATIDNDITGVDLTIGADTSVNVALDALDKIRDTATSLERIFVVEVMGRCCGYIAMQVALAGGCEEVLLPERDLDPDSMCGEIKKGHERGKVSWIIITAEGKARAQDVAAAITRATGLETRIAVLGHIQRGGRPTALDRILAARLAHAAVEALMEGKSDVCVHLKNGRIEFLPLETAIRPKVCDVTGDYHLLKVLA